jgi:hypothetical protein
MKRIQQVAATLILGLGITLTTHAGEINTPGYVPPPPCTENCPPVDPPSTSSISSLPLDAAILILTLESLVLIP